MKVGRCELFGARRKCIGDSVGSVEVDAPPCTYDAFEFSNSVDGGTYVDDFQNFELLYASLTVGSIIICLAFVGLCIIAASRKKNLKSCAHHTVISVLSLLIGIAIMAGCFILNSKIRYDSDVRCHHLQYAHKRPPGYMNEEECANRFWCDGKELSEENASLYHAVSYLFITSAAMAGCLTASVLFLSLTVGRGLCFNRDLCLNSSSTEEVPVVRVEIQPAAQAEVSSIDSTG